MTKSNNFTSRIAGIATLALAALPMVALSTAAHAATSVKVGDLNLLTSDGVSAFHQRADVASRKFCRGTVISTQRVACRDGVRAELTDKMAAVRQAQLAQQSRAFAAR